MLFQIVILLLILGLIAFYAFEGFYSATVMAICCVLSGMLAFNYFEPLAETFRESAPRFAYSLALGGLFIAALVALRLTADRMLGGMVHVPLILDRAGGAVMGTLAAMIVVGVLAICVRMLPFGPSILGYQALTAHPAPGRPAAVEQLWLGPDRFTVALVEMLSGGSLSGTNSFSDTHPDYIARLAGFGSFPSGSNTPFAPNAIKESGLAAVALGEAEHPDDMPADRARQARVRLFKIPLTVSVLPEEGGAALAPGQAQLIARKDEQAVLLLPHWIQSDGDAKIAALTPFSADQAWRHQSDAKKPTPTINLVYAVPEGFTPRELVVKRDTRIEISIPRPDAESHGQGQ